MTTAVGNWNKDSKVVSRLNSYCCNDASVREAAQNPGKKRNCTSLYLIPELKKKNNSSFIKQYTHIKLHLHSRIYQCDYSG